jgi:hypothetical protein
MNARAMLLWVALAAPAVAQMRPASAHVNLYFPQLADGGSVNVWQTAITFINPNATPASVSAYFYDNNGQALPLFDFGSGPVAQFQDLAIPAGGVRVVKSMRGKDAVAGWGIAYASVPVQGIVSYRRYDNGTATLEVADNATLPTISYSSYANAMLGVALGNIYDVDMPLILTVFDADGHQYAQQTITLKPSGHDSFNLTNRFSLPANFEGTLAIDSTTDGPAFFVAWTLNVSDVGLLAALPSGRYAFPDSQLDRIENVFYTMRSQAEDFAPGVSLDLSTTTDRLVSAGITSTANGSTIRISLATAELIATSDGELAFLLGHEMGHGIQNLHGQTLYYQDSEIDADSIGLRLALAAGYDPYAAAGLFGKLRMASTEAGLLGDILGNATAGNPHTDFGDRGDTIVAALRDICSGTLAACQTYKDFVHPHAPAPYPLSRGVRGRSR